SRRRGRLPLVHPTRPVIRSTLDARRSTLDASGSGELAAPRRQSLLRSFLAARSFPRRPPAHALPQAFRPLLKRKGALLLFFTPQRGRTRAEWAREECPMCVRLPAATPRVRVPQAFGLSSRNVL